MGRPQLGPKAHQIGDAAPWQILDFNLSQWFPLTLDKFWHDTDAIERYMQFCFQWYIGHRKTTPYVTWVFVLLCTAPGLKTGHEHELLWASTLGSRTWLASCLLFDLDTLVGLLLLHSMHKEWSYAWVSCPHHSLLLKKSRPRCRLYLKTILHNTNVNPMYYVLSFVTIFANDMILISRQLWQISMCTNSFF
jgi:hypothetical protein